MEGLGKHNDSGWVKMYRSLLSWRWFTDAKTLQVWFWLLLKANIKPHGFEGITVNRGQVATSYASIASQTKSTYSQARTAISHLKCTGEIAVHRMSNFLVISILNYDSYQSVVADLNADSSQSHRRPIAITSQQSKIVEIERKEEASFDSEESRKWEDELHVPARFRGRFPDAESYLAFADRRA